MRYSETPAAADEPTTLTWVVAVSPRQLAVSVTSPADTPVSVTTGVVESVATPARSMVQVALERYKKEQERKKAK